MDPFVRDLLTMPPLDAVEELELARRARTGDRQARAALITAGLRSVALRARLRGLRGEELRDAVQSGAVGLIRAVDRFDPDRGVRLATYAWRWIGAEMAMAPTPEVPVETLEVACDEQVSVDPRMLDDLPGDLARVLSLRFGLGDPAAAPMPRQAVAARLGLTVAQVRTLEAKAMRQLRARLAKVVDRAPPQGGADPP